MNTPTHCTQWYTMHAQQLHWWVSERWRIVQHWNNHDTDKLSSRYMKSLRRLFFVVSNNIKRTKQRWCVVGRDNHSYNENWIHTFHTQRLHGLHCVFNLVKTVVYISRITSLGTGCSRLTKGLRQDVLIVVIYWKMLTRRSHCLWCFSTTTHDCWLGRAVTMTTTPKISTFFTTDVSSMFIMRDGFSPPWTSGTRFTCNAQGTAHQVSLEGRSW